ncbi:MAG: methyltransferase domain-containing protein [Elusimicrobia bacterium]|nr:methyltransferase domain-containing protein [Elusimicrobiota bacterium]
MCDGGRLVKVFGLPPTPPGNNFLNAKQLNDAEPRYPLDVYLCGDCSHIQLGHVVDPKILFQNNYPYVSATSGQFVKHLQDHAEAMVKRFELKPGALVSDIGSNDGTCLRFFKEHGMRVVGVDPAIQIAQAANRAGIETVGEFFSFELAQHLRKQHGPAAFVTSHNACAHIDMLDDVVRGVSHWLQDDGVFVLEVGYFVDVFSNLWFDTIYHEHLDYHTVGPFKKLFARSGMELISVQRVSPQGGSIRVMAQKKGGPHRVDSSVQESLDLELRLELNQLSAFKKFFQRIETAGGRLRLLLQSLKKSGKSIAAYGATTKGTTLLSTFGVGKESIDFIVDDNPLKQGMFSPALHIPVLETEELYRRRPDYVLILAWNFAGPIMAKHARYVEQGGRFILPMPEPRVV